MESNKVQLLKRLLGTELSSLKTECAQLSNDIREIVAWMESDLKTLSEGLLKSCKEVNRERDEAVKLYKLEETRRRDLLNQLHVLKGNIRVVCRVRPVNKIDEEKGSKDIAVFRASRELVRCGGRDFEFDEVFGPKHTNTHVFDEALPMVESVFEGFHACIFAYGQTGSGKTFTMSGCPSDRGVNYRAVERLFEMREAMLSSGMYAAISFHVSNVEIYNETVRDLLTKSMESNELQIRQDLENGIYLPGCNKVKAETPKAVWETMEFGQKNRAQALTKMNSESSRSHSVFMVDVEAVETASRVVRGKLILVDLAGSERLSKSGVSGERQREAQCINKSLSALGDVICALGSKASHVPFRNSKLTYLLQDSMSKQNKVMMIVQTAPTSYNIQESLCTLSFGSRARAVELGRAEARGAILEVPPLQQPSHQNSSAALLPSSRQPMSVNPAVTSNKQHNELLMQKIALEQKVLSMERALAEAEAKAAMAQKAMAKKEELVARTEKERDDALQRLNLQLRARKTSSDASSNSTKPTNRSVEPSKRQQEREKAIQQVKARLAEQERVTREAKERMVTPSRQSPMMMKFGGFSTANGVPSLSSAGYGSGGKAAASLPLPPPITSSILMKSASKQTVGGSSLGSSASFSLSSSSSRSGLAAKDSENRIPFSSAGIVPRKLQTSFGPSASGGTLPVLTFSSGVGRPSQSLLGGSGPARVLGGGALVVGTTGSSATSTGFGSFKRMY